jgi:HK97 family phage major capsid protein
MTIDKEELKTMLTEFKTNVEKAIVDKTKEVSDASTKDVNELKEKLATAEKALNDIKKATEKSFGLPGLESEKKSFSWSKYFTGLYKNHKSLKGDISTSEVKSYWDSEASFESRICKDYSAVDGSSGGFIIPPQIYQGDVVDTVYANTAIMKMPVMKFENLKTDMPIPIDKGNLSAYFVGENEAPTKTGSSFGLEWLRPKKIAVYVPVSERLMYATSNAIEMIVKGKMARDAAVKMSYGLTAGKGSEKEPKGILQYYNNFTGKKNLDTNGRRFSIDDLAAQKQALAAADELMDSSTYGTIMRPEVFWGMLRERNEFVASQAVAKQGLKVGSLLIDQTAIQSALKLSIESTTQIPKSSVGTSSTCSKVITGDWSKFAVGTFRDPIFKVSDQASDASGNSAFLNDQLFMLMIMEVDCVCTRPTSFCAFDGAETAEASW